MSLLKKALLKAGVVTEAQVKVVERKEQEARQAKRRPPPPPPKPRTVAPPEPPKETKHLHHARTFCEACGKTSPDVEFYKHTNKMLEKYWLCVKCADEHYIHDDLRQTAQSFDSMTHVFRRQYGPTKVFK